MQTSVTQVSLNYYRPITMLSFAINHLLHGLKPFGFHLVNLGLHAAASVFIYFLFSKMNFSIRISLLSALVFSVLPIHTEAVSNIVGRSEIMATLFFLAAWSVMLWERKPLKIAVGLGLFLFALLSKESAACFPFVFALAEITCATDPVKDVIRKRFPIWIMLAATVGLFLEWRWLVLGSFFPVTDSPYFTNQPFLIRTLTVARFLFSGYLWPMISGLNLCADYLRPTFLDATLTDPVAWTCLLIIVALGVGSTVRLFSKKDPVAFGFLVFLLFYLPVSNFILDIAYCIGAERFMYAPSIGLSLLAGIAFDRLDSLKKRNGIFLAAILLAWWGYRTIQRNQDWRNETSFFSALVEEKKNNPNGWNGLGTVLDKEGRHAEARVHYLKALTLNDTIASPVYNMGTSYYSEGDFVNAKKWLQRCATQTNFKKDALTFLGVIAMRENKDADAFQFFSQAAQLYPLDPGVRQNLDFIMKKMGKIK